MDYTEFRAEVLKLNTNKRFKVRNSLGTKQAWRWIKKNKWLSIGQPITEHDFGLIIKTINKSLKDQLFKGHDIILPEKMGRIELRKYNSKIKLDKGKVKTNLPINWDRTLKLWHHDKEAKDLKILVRQEAKVLFKILYNKGRANYNNQSFYQFIPNRDFKKELSKRINDDNIDAFLF